MDRKTAGEQRKGVSSESLNRNSDVIMLISDDEVEFITEQKMDTIVEEKCTRTEKTQRTERDNAAADNQTVGQWQNSDMLLRLIRKYSCYTKSSVTAHVTGPSFSAIWSPFHLQNIIQVCSHSPYCLYLFLGVELDGGQSTSVVLIGYIDQCTGDSVVRLLDSLQLSVDMVAPQTSADDAHLLIMVLKKFGLTLSNISVFYCDAPHPEDFVSQLCAFNPKLLSLCGLPGILERACHMGFSASFRHVVVLITAIHRHYSACPSVNDSLKALFADAEPFNPVQHSTVSAQYLIVIRSVQRMVTSWRDLVEYFKTLKSAEDTDLIKTQLLDAKVKLQFIFLSHALEPFRALQEFKQSATVDVGMELQLISVVVHAYATSILQPGAAERFVSKRDLRLLHDCKELLPTKKVTIGSCATDFMWSTPVVDLGEQERSNFLKDAVVFYKAALQSLMESIPEQLGDVALKNISIMQRLPDNISDERVPPHVVSELGVQLGLCKPSSIEEHQLALDYMYFIRKGMERRTGEGRCWAKLWLIVRQHSILQQLLQTLLVLPSSLRRQLVFAKVFTEPLCSSKKAVSPQTSSQPQRTRIHGRMLPVQAGHDDRGKVDVSTESSSELSDTDNSSDVIDVTETFESRKTKCSPEEITLIVDSDDDSDDDDEEVEHMDLAVTQPTDSEGELVWGRGESFSLWPAVIIACRGGKKVPGKRLVEWFGKGTSCQISVNSLKPFAAFTQCFCSKSFAILATYREAIFLSLKEAALRCMKQFSVGPDDHDELVKEMLNWAFEGFQPSGPDGLKPVNSNKDVSLSLNATLLKSNNSSFSIGLKQVSVSLNRLSCLPTEKSTDRHREGKNTWEEGDKLGNRRRVEKASRGEKAVWSDEENDGWDNVKVRWGRERGKGRKVPKKKTSLSASYASDMSPDYVPHKKRAFTKIYNKVNPTSFYTQPDQKVRAEVIRRIIDMNLDIEGFCLCCGTENVAIFHPLFKGSLCSECKDNFSETLHRYDEDGYQSYCTVCCYGMEVLLCGNDSCCRSYCADCLNILVGVGTFDSLKPLDPWICYMCQPHQAHGALIPREDWSIRVQQYFANDSAIEFEPHRVYPSVPANLRRPIRVLSLFDGIATGYLVLKDLGFKVEKYVASEVCEDSIAVGTVNHDGKIIHIGDVRYITQEHIEKWGPFDLLIGGSPCNDLSIVNPLRKGLYEGSGRLFFDFYRILQLLKPKGEDPRPFFWLFENVVFMNTHDKVNMCRFLECNPVLIDAVKVSPAHRARNFWGNIPGMSRPIIASQKDKLSLQECLEIGREAKVTKVRTITTNPNSLKQGKCESQLPVLYNGRDDSLWITELEKIFGFPKHYTDVRNMNRQQRQKVLGKAWSVPVIRHLFAPLKDYFAFEELPHLTTSCIFSTSTSTSSVQSSPASPEVQQLR